MNRNFGFGLNLDLFSMILNNRSKTWKSEGLFSHVLGCNITIDGKFSMIYMHGCDIIRFHAWADGDPFRISLENVEIDYATIE